jgi:hypothetical protein
LLSWTAADAHRVQTRTFAGSPRVNYNAKVISQK